MPQISQHSLLPKNTNPATNSPRPSPFRVAKILIYAMPNPDYHKIDLQAP